MCSRAFPKPMPRILEKQERQSALAAEDRRQRALCRSRSSGRCEVVTVTPKPERSELLVTRCKRKAVANHHMLNGVGRRNVGDSILAVHRLDVCSTCHQLLHAKVLCAIDRDWQYDALHVRFEVVTR